VSRCRPQQGTRDGPAQKVATSLKELPKIYFEKLLERSPDIVVAADRRGTIIFYNDGARQTLGYSAGEVLGKSVYMLYPSEAEAKRVMAALRSADHGGNGQIHNFECELKHKNGHVVAVAMSGSVIHDPRGKEHGSIGFAKEIAELQLHERIHTLGELAIGLAHEINNPLETLVNHVEMLERFLKKTTLGDEYRAEHARLIAMKRELRRIQAIVERVGEMAQEGHYGTIEYLPGKLMTDLGIEPEREPESDSESEQTPAATSATADANENRHLTGKTVLIVDDDPDVSRSVSEILADEGCNVVVSHSGSEALSALDSQKIDLVLSDVVMPDMDGYELFRTLQKTRPDLPIVLMTAYYYDKDHVLKRSAANGLKDVIFKKPIKPARLIELIDARIGA
jgi:PAS domain S-box-containing protein